MKLSRRERQIMDILYQLGEATVRNVLAELPDPPSYTSVRTQLRVLEEKGHLQHRQEGPRYIYSPKIPKKKAWEISMRQMLRTFFEGSPAKAVAALVGMEGTDLKVEELKELQSLIEEARRKAE